MIAVGLFGGNCCDRHIKGATGIGWRIEKDIANIAGRDSISFGAIWLQGKGILDAGGILQDATRRNIGNFKRQDFRSVNISQIAGQIVKKNANIFVGGFGVTGNGRQVGDRYNIYDIVMMHRCAIAIARQTGINIGFSSGDIDPERNLT